MDRSDLIVGNGFGLMFLILAISQPHNMGYNQSYMASTAILLCTAIIGIMIYVKDRRERKRLTQRMVDQMYRADDFFTCSYCGARYHSNDEYNRHMSLEFEERVARRYLRHGTIPPIDYTDRISPMRLDRWQEQEMALRQLQIQQMQMQNPQTIILTVQKNRTPKDSNIQNKEELNQRKIFNAISTLEISD